ncbi:MAG TPA: DinB family protein, partial [Flavisolibacter sp.]|nr:DinB family protein [Flavisolibacter sp.]
MDLQLNPTINQIDMVKRTRAYLLSLVKDLSTEQLNLVPHGFNNNIIWNIGHMIAAQQGVCYVRAGLKVTIDEALFLAYKSDTKP